MSLAADFARAVGERIAHVTARSNLARVADEGLYAAADLARHAGIPPEEITLRTDRRRLGSVILNHQRPLLTYQRAAEKMLDGYDLRGWAAQLDERIFFWPQSKGQAFARSIERDMEISVIWLDAHDFARFYSQHIDLSPINSGNFSQGGANVPRGDWIYRPLNSGMNKFRIYRKSRGLTRYNDSVGEISLRCPLPADDLKVLRVPPPNISPA